MKNVTQTISIQLSLKGITKDVVKITQLTKKQEEPINVFVSLNILYLPMGHFFPVKAAIGSHIANIKMGK